MNRNAKFWYSMLVFQFLFGLAVFALTRDYYLHEAEVARSPTSMSRQPTAGWTEGTIAADIARLGPQLSNNLPTEDPVEISRRAEEYFASKQYDKAAAMYERLLAFSPNDAEIHNNLGLTLHYLGRSDEALQRLEEGVALAPENQRIWLTLGFVNSAVGNNDKARLALVKATQIGTDESIRESANKMLDALP
jgi:tetratricopeptide (TPR) repeat protein